MEREEKIRVVVRAKPYASCSTTPSPETNQDTITSSPDGSAVYVYTDEARSKAASFQCDAFLPPQMRQDEVFDAIQAPQLIESALDGFPVTIFAYGQTGAGKSFTIFGKEDGVTERKLRAQPSDGLLPRIVGEIMRLVDSRRADVEYTLRLTCVEIYNEQVRDVFDPRKESLQVRSSKQHGFFLENATVVQCESAAEIVRVVKTAAANRTKSSHLLNERSNRSHCLVTIYIDSMPLTNGGIDDGAAVKKYGKLTIVDLAGSERVNDTGAVGAQLKETGHINKSLYCLNQVIQALNARAKSKFVPVRDSKLTMLLIDSLGGNSKTLMIACVNSAPQFSTESIRTLEFAMGVAKIKNRPTAVLSPHERLILDLKEQIRLLKLENLMLRSRTPGYFTDHPGAQMAPEDYEDLQYQNGGPMVPLTKALVTTRLPREENQDSHESARDRGVGLKLSNAPRVQRAAAMPTQRQSKSSGEVQSSLRTLKKKKQQPTRSKLTSSPMKKKPGKKSSSLANDSGYALPPVRQFLAPHPPSSQARPASPPPEYDDLFFGLETIPIPMARGNSHVKLVALPPSSSHHDLQQHHQQHNREQLLIRTASPPPEYASSPEEQLQRLLQQINPQQTSSFNEHKAAQVQLAAVQMQSKGAVLKSLMTNSRSMQWDDDRAQQLFQQLCNLKG